MTYGAAWGDYDGMPDLYVTNRLKPAVLFRNLGGGRFEDVTAVVLGDQTGGDKHGAAWMEAVQSMLETPDRYADLSARALAHARSDDFSPPELARRFLAASQAPAPKVGMIARGRRAWRRYMSNRHSRHFIKPLPD